MRAARIHEYGPPEVLRIDDVEPGAVGPNDVGIDVYASSVNPIDTKIRSGGQAGVIRYRLPHTLGLDVSGIVTAVGDLVTDFEIGDAVFSSPTHRRPGCYAESVVIDASAVAKKPANCTHQEAASLPLVTLTAWQALIDHGGIRTGDRVFVQAGSGGVGSMAIQIAKHFGAEVAATCSTRNVELVESLGADRVVDYTKEKYDEVLSDYDVVVDNLGFEHKDRALSILKRGGRIELVVGGIPAAVKKHGKNLGSAIAIGHMAGFMAKAFLTRGVRGRSVLRPSRGSTLAQIAALVDEGALRPVVDRCFELDDIVDAHRYSETSRARGKIVIKVRS